MLATAMYLTQAGKLPLKQTQAGTLLNSQLTSSTIFFLCTFKMHAKVIKQKDKYMKYCLWRGSDINNRKPPKAACQKKGGYSWGVLNLTTQYEAKLCIQGLLHMTALIFFTSILFFFLRPRHFDIHPVLIISFVFWLD